jgi:hypothetical protein
MSPVKEKGGKPERKPYLHFYVFRNPYINPMSENFHYYAQKPQRNCVFMNMASVLHHVYTRVKRHIYVPELVAQCTGTGGAVCKGATPSIEQ